MSVSAIIFSLAYQLSATSGPVDAALKSTETPDTFRAAFTVTLKSPKAVRTFSFDPREQGANRWSLLEASGEDDDLDEAVAAWASEPAPDGRLFPDDLRPSIGQRVNVQDFGAAWRVRFRHKPSINDGELDVWIAERVNADAWLDPVSGKFLRLDYSLPRSVRGPDGGRLTKFEQSYFLESDPEWGLSYIAAYTMGFEAKGGFQTINRNYTATVTSIEFFFSSPEAEEKFEAQQHHTTGRALANR
ncbi:hypothetical protein WNY37_08095 [Henriciella sp. AS95]|uniref:hypothetical protein n=1 Tax=Henriciella sp. AS95 TaxID=3135782 RepID=UPI0031801758